MDIFWDILYLAILLLVMQKVKTDCPAYSTHYNYCIIGAGPAGLQLGYYLEKAGRNYTIFERSDIAASFFEKYPRHRTLISINKRNTGSTNKEYNLRHDWNSLLSDNDMLSFRHYSKEMFPNAGIMVRYLNDFANYYKIKIQYNKDVSIDVVRDRDGRKMQFIVTDQHNITTYCSIVIVATGLWAPNIPDMDGVHLSVGYENVSTNPEDFEAKSVLILGRGNSAFETANSIYENTNFVHMLGRQRIRLAWETHYVGDIRAVNNGLLDTYQLKSLDGLLEFDDVAHYRIIQKNGKLYLRNHDDDSEIWSNYDNDPLLMPYDYIIRCLGFKFDRSVFKNESHCPHGNGRLKKYPVISPDFQSTSVDDLFYAGTIAHSLDYRISAGGFIHGFRYAVRSLHHILSWRYHHERWPHKVFSTGHLISTITKRISETSGLYQMSNFLGDVIVFQQDNTEFAYFEEFPIKLLSNFENTTGYSIYGKNILVIVLQYGDDYHGPMEDVFRVDRATTDPKYAHLSNFLHPVIYYYNSSQTATSMSKKLMQQILPHPTKLHHMVEDFNTIWHHPHTHIKPLITFLENCLNMDLQFYSNHQCCRLSMTTSKVPITCLPYVQSRPVYA